jgi:hypothetical protein
MGDPPLIQSKSQPCPGYYVSRTALEDPSAAVDSPTRYVDSLTIPSLTVPCADLGKWCGGKGFKKLGLGDVGSVSYTDPHSGARAKQAFIVGNCSVAGIVAPSVFLAKALGGAAGTATIRCGSIPLGAWPRTPDSIDRQVEAYAGGCPKGCLGHGDCNNCACTCDRGGLYQTCYGGPDCGKEYCAAPPQTQFGP